MCAGAQITLQDVKGDLEPAELAAAVAPEVGAGGEGAAPLHVSVTGTEQVGTAGRVPREARSWSLEVPGQQDVW